MVHPPLIQSAEIDLLRLLAPNFCWDSTRPDPCPDP